MLGFKPPRWLSGFIIRLVSAQISLRHLGRGGPLLRGSDLGRERFGKKGVGAGQLDTPAEDGAGGLHVLQGLPRASKPPGGPSLGWHQGDQIAVV